MKTLKWRDGLIFFEEVNVGDPTKVPDPKEPPPEKPDDDEEEEENGEKASA